MKNIHKYIFFIVFSFTFISIIIMSTVPPVSRDAQTHHLALPKIWLKNGVLSEVPDMDFSYYPQLLDLLYYLPIKYNADIVAKYIHFAFGLGCMVLIFLFISRYINYNWGLLGSLMFLTLPIILKLSVTVYVDLGLLFFFSASLFSAIIWLENTKKTKWLVICGIASGLAMSTKYNAILSVVILTLLISYFFTKLNSSRIKSQWKLLKYVFLFSLISILVYSPWLIRNYTLTGNPVYPLYKNVFSKTEVQATEFSKAPSVTDDKKLKPITLRKLLYNESLIYSLALPLRVFYEGQDDNLQFFDGKINPLLLLFPFILVILKKRNWQNNFLAGYVALTLVYTTLAIDMRIRYIISILSPMVVLSTFGLYHLKKWLDRKTFPKYVTELVLTGLIGIYFVYNINYGIKLFHRIDPIPYIMGDLDRDQYINQHLPYYSLNKLANQKVPLDGKLLGIYTGNRRYYIDVPLILDSELIFNISNHVNNANQLFNEFSKLHITHILVRVDLFNSQINRHNEKIRNIIANFFTNNTQLLKHKGLFALYKIKGV